MSDQNVSEKIGLLMAKADAAHSRIDKLEIELREDLRGIFQELKALAGDINHGKGWASAGKLLLTLILGAGGGTIITVIIVK